MRRVYITFSGKAYDPTTAIIASHGKQFGADEVWIYDDRWLVENFPDFMRMNHWLWEPGVKPENPGYKFGFGWCAWKPLVIMEAMKHCQPGDVVLYTDADTYPTSDLSEIFDGCANSTEGIFLFESQGNYNDRFTRRDCFVAMGLDDPKYDGRIQGCGRFSLFRAGSWAATQFLIEWLAYAINPMCQMVAPSKYAKDHESYHRHSNEQSILTLLGYKYGLAFHREACQWGASATSEKVATMHLDQDKYPELFHQVYCGGNRADLSGSSYRNFP